MWQAGAAGVRLDCNVYPSGGVAVSGRMRIRQGGMMAGLSHVCRLQELEQTQFCAEAPPKGQI